MANDGIIIFTTDQSEYMGGEESAILKPVKTSVDQLKKSFQLFSTSLQEIVQDLFYSNGGYSVEQVEISASIDAEGSIGILGFGANIGATAGIKIIIKHQSAGPGTGRPGDERL